MMNEVKFMFGCLPNEVLEENTYIMNLIKKETQQNNKF